MNLCSIEMCTGCAACFNACNRDAISFVADEEGFLRPNILQDRCVECGACVRACPVLQSCSFPKDEKCVYACWHNDVEIRRKSTSGGAFTALAVKILEMQGVVYGASFKDVTRVVHQGFEEVAQLERLRGSKYIQSEIQYVFREVKILLREGRHVLFSGTPCQVAGLYAFLGRRYEELLTTVDVVCHGVPSPKIFKDYVQWLEQKHQAKVESYQFRNKAFGWYLHASKIKFNSGKVLTEHFFKNNFSRGFLRDFFLRPSCYKCQYTNINRPADITLADFWGYQAQQKNGRDKDDDKGVSMIMLNSEKGKSFFELAKGDLVVWGREVSHAVAGNPALRSPFPAPVNRKVFWSDYKKLPFNQLLQKYMYSEQLTDWWIFRYKKVFYGQYVCRRMRNIVKRILRTFLSEKIISRLKTLYK